MPPLRLGAPTSRPCTHRLSDPELGAGELLKISEIAIAVNEGADPPNPVLDDPDRLRQKRIDRAARYYLKQLRNRKRSAKRITDKMPLNVAQLGLISLLFPGATVIHCRRDPLDTCLSCYFSNFAVRNEFTYDLQQLGRFYSDYRRIMAHWRRVLDLNLIEVDYEALVQDQDEQTRRLLYQIGLPFADECLRFHETERTVLTLSSEQVRRPMYKTSIARHKPYEEHLAPLREALGDLPD